MRLLPFASWTSTLLLLLGVTVPGSASALSEWGTQAVASRADCPSFCTNFTFGVSTGGQNQATATSSVDSPFQGTANALAELDTSPGLSVPVLKGEAFSNSGGLGSAFSTAFASEGYTYTGPGSMTFTLNITLTGSVSDPTPGDNDTFIQADVVIFAEENYLFIADLPTLIFEAGATPIDQLTLRLDPDVTDGTLLGSVSFTLSTGESVYLWANLDAEAQRDLSFADAFGTLTTTFQDDTGLVAASVVPEPGTAALLLIGALGLACPGRRRTD
jgi:hypothetical protein